MGRKISIIIFILIFVSAIGGLYYFLKSRQLSNISALNAIPQNSAVIVRVNTPATLLASLNSGNDFWNGLKKIGSFNTFCNNLITVDSIIKTNADLSGLLTDKQIFVSLHQNQAGAFEPLILVEMGSNYNAKNCIKLFTRLLEGFGKTNLTNPQKMMLYSFAPDTTAHDSLYATFEQGLLIISRSNNLLKLAHNSITIGNGINTNPELAKIINTAGVHANAHLFIQHQKLAQYAPVVFSDQFTQQIKNNRLAQWSVYDINIKNRTVLINGFSINNQLSTTLAGLFSGQQPVTMQFQSVVPAMASSFTAFGVSNIGTYRANLQAFLNNNGNEKYFANANNIISNTFGVDAIAKLEQLFNNEAVQITNIDGQTFFLLKTKGNRDAVEFLSAIFSFYTLKNQWSILNIQKEYRLDNETVFQTFKMPFSQLPSLFFGPWFNSCSANYVTAYNEYIVFADSYKGLTNFIYQNVLQKTIKYDVNYNRFSDYLTVKSNIYHFTSLATNSVWFNKNLSQKALKIYNINKNAINNYYGIALQFANENHFMYGNILFRYQPTSNKKEATEWETRLDTLITFKPVIVNNHVTGEKEIFVQDLKNNIYLINNTGRIIWQQKIDGQILGEVFQVDYYKNGKLQFLFNTNNKLHLIDRNGNYVEKYPITLPSPANVPLSLFDYENRKDYRIFIGLTNNQIVAYNINGQVVTGFGFTGTDNKIIAPVEYFRNNNKDYLVVTDEYRVYILDRRGSDRVKPQKRFNPSANNTFIYQAGNQSRPSRLVRTDTSGIVHYIYFDGRVETKEIKKFTANHFFDCQDITGNGAPDFIFVDKNMLEVYDLLGNLLFKYSFDSPITHRPSFYKFSSKKVLTGITHAANSKIYLFNSNGQIEHGFPLPGKTRFSIGLIEQGSDKFNLIVGGDNQYLYNYKLQ